MVASRLLQYRLTLCCLDVLSLKLHVHERSVLNKRVNEINVNTPGPKTVTK